jgi:conjugative transfer signal peptidase TraF
VIACRRGAAMEWRPAVFGLMALGMVLIVAGRHTPSLIYNASASAPIGLYRVLPAAPLGVGDLVLVPMPRSVAPLAAGRGYLPMSVPLVKRIAALAGTTVCAVGNRVSIGGEFVAERLASDRAGRALPAWTGCGRLGAGEIFLLMKDVPDSFDSRYFGPVAAGTVIGRLAPLWLP